MVYNENTVTNRYENHEFSAINQQANDNYIKITCIIFVHVHNVIQACKCLRYMYYLAISNI